MRFQHGRRGQPDPVADLGDGEGGVLLQHGQDLAVDGVEAAVGFMKLNGEVGHEKNVPYERFHPSYIENSSIASPLLAGASRAGAAWPWLKSSSTSIRCGAAKAPPKRVHFSAAAAEANRSACRSSCPSVMASAKAPWNTSPAPSVSTVWTGKAGVSWIAPFSSSQIVPLGPRVPARNDGSVWRSSSAPRRRR